MSQNSTTPVVRESDLPIYIAIALPWKRRYFPLLRTFMMALQSSSWLCMECNHDHEWSGEPKPLLCSQATKVCGKAKKKWRRYYYIYTLES